MRQTISSNKGVAIPRTGNRLKRDERPKRLLITSLSEPIAYHKIDLILCVFSLRMQLGAIN